MPSDNHGIDNTPDLGGAFGAAAGPTPPEPPATPTSPWSKPEAQAIRDQLVEPTPTPVLKPDGRLEMEINREAQAKYERDAARLNYIEQALADQQGSLEKAFEKAHGFGR